MASSTWVIRSAKLLHDKELASVLLRVMMAMNDLGVANSALYEWDRTDDPKKRVRQNGGKLYFGRMQMGHVYEALLIIQTIKANPRLTAAVKRCDQRTQASFDAVAVFLKSDDFKILRRIRNNAAFHYDGKLAIRHLEHIVEKFPNHPFAYSLGHETLDWYFLLGDEIIDRLVVRDIFKIPEGTDLRAELDAILLRLHKMATAFTDFAGYFIRHYAK